jgi:hypothetical protein
MVFKNGYSRAKSSVTLYPVWGSSDTSGKVLGKTLKDGLVLDVANSVKSLKLSDFELAAGASATLNGHTAPVALVAGSTTLVTVVVTAEDGYTKTTYTIKVKCAAPPAPPSSSTAKPTSSTAKPTSSTAKPTSSTAKPTTSTAKPTTSTAKPTSSTAKPTSSTAKPTSSTAKPTSSTAKPTTSTAKPSSSTAKPTGSGTKPTSTAAKPAAKVGTVTITGTAKIGDKTTAKTGATLTAKATSVTPSGAAVTYQWLRDGQPIPGATKATYKVTAADTGHALTVKATAAKTGYTAGGKTSAAVVPGLAAMHRFYNKTTGAHFYTAKEQERQDVLDKHKQFQYEGIVGYVLDKTTAGAGEEVVYRFYNTTTGVHFYTADVKERDYVRAHYKEWRYEGAAFTAYSGTAPGRAVVYRFYNAARGCHFYTANASEAAYVKNHYKEWNYEGTAYHIIV